MYAPRVNSTLCSPKQAARIGRAVVPLLVASTTSPVGLRCTVVAFSHTTAATTQRCFSTTPANRLRDIFPVKETAHVRTTPPAWPHHGYTEAEMLAVVPGHRKPETWGDKLAWYMVRTARWCMDTVTGMSKEQRTNKKQPTTAVLAERPLTEAQWVSSVVQFDNKRPVRLTEMTQISSFAFSFSSPSLEYPAWLLVC